MLMGGSSFMNLDEKLISAAAEDASASQTEQAAARLELAQHFGRIAAVVARVWIEPDTPSHGHGETIVPIFTDRGAPLRKRRGHIGL